MIRLFLLINQFISPFHSNFALTWSSSSFTACLFTYLHTFFIPRNFSESLRLYPPLPILTRKCIIPYKIPNTDVIIEEGTNVVVVVLGLQRDPSIYPHPNSFFPERHFRDDAENRHPYTFLPFGEGPKGCIGKYKPHFSQFCLQSSKIFLNIFLKFEH